MTNPVMIDKEEMLVLCDCPAREHQLWFWYDDEMMYIQPKLNREANFLKRIGIAFHYIFRPIPSVYGDFDDLVILESKVLREMSQYFQQAADYVKGFEADGQ